MLQKQQQDGGDGLHDDLLVPVDVDAQFHALQHGGPARVEHSGELSLHDASTGET